MLHGVTDVTCLDNVLNDNGGLAVNFISRILVHKPGTVTLLEGFVPPVVTQCLEVFIGEVGTHDCINNQLGE
jgi:hypothetical protein